MLVHEFENHHHRLVYLYEDGGSKAGDWTGYDQIASLDEYRAVTNHFSHVLPPVFRVEAVTEYKNHHYDVNSDGYWSDSLPEK